MKKRKSQVDKVKTWLEIGGSVNPLTALKQFGAFRLADIIHRLRKKGMIIETDMSKGYATYRLVSTA